MSPKFLSKLIPKRQLPDNFIFYLHYRWTVLLLVTLCLIVTCRLFLGNTFACEVTNISASQRLIETGCYAGNVYSLPGEHFNDVNVTTADPSTRGFRRYQTYYSWVNLFFLVHAFNFYLPHLLWKSYESGYLCRLTSGIECYKGEKRSMELCYLAKYILVTQGKHKLYTCFYILCEIFNYCVALSHTLWLVYFFDVTGVPDFLHFQIKTWSDFQLFYFPKYGICTYHELYRHFTPAQEYSGTCLLPLNQLYMLMFLFVHAWYIFLTISAGIVLVFRIVLLIPSVRMNVTRFYAPLPERPILKSLCSRLSYSDWFFLTRFQRVMNDIDFAQMLEKITVVSQFKTYEVDSDENKICMCDEYPRDLDNSDTTSPV
ncbi:innexin inx2-like [Parasteatoda tepidariorum]|uniref:innexin inx2-like n=1 Tax=Parasteatoda tepidariorum TaxID=114398 RepID=UPI00077FD0EC|nr:innexin inx2-like [Parasteatoda tepidariorum]